MAHGLNSVLKRGPAATVSCKTDGKGVGGSRRIFAPHFKLQVLDSYRNDADCKGNQRATARKYGIHRRQIQKWLQAEGALRSSVSAKERSPSASEAALNGGRQRGDDSGAPAGGEARVPSPDPGPCALPLDFTTHRRSEQAPIDLSVRARRSAAPEPEPPRAPSPQPHPDVWDLSTKGLKRKCPSRSGSEASPKPVKLFKPYLLDEDDDQNKGDAIDVHVDRAEEPLVAPCCSLATQTQPPCESYFYNNNNNVINNNNNNVVCDIVSEYGYTLHELQPKTNYFYAYPSYHGVECESPGSGYCTVYEDIGYGQSLAPLKQRQSYSLDFKLSAIDCYYQDSVCKGNQRAVATKYNIHRRQVQKWLKQAEELRLRNETIKQMHAVR